MGKGKTLRFQIFSRDGFTCQYCGQRPPEVVLELDHIHPRAKGGSDDSLNLVTACWDCNRGKRDKILSEFPNKPDADMRFLEAQQEIAEMRRYLMAKEELDQILEETCNSLQNTWAEYLTPCVPTNRVFTPWINSYGAQEIEVSIKLATTSYTNGRFGSDDDRAFSKLLRYVGAMLRNRRDDREGGVL